jgi:hypothetical protein
LTLLATDQDIYIYIYIFYFPKKLKPFIMYIMQRD